MQEIENKEAALQNFIGEIKKIKESFPSLFAVEDVNDLEIEEYKVWEEYKLLFKKIEAALAVLDLRHKDVLTGLQAEVSSLVKSIAEILPITKNSNRLEFLAWMNNRLVGLSYSLQSLQSDKANEELLKRNRDRLSEEKRGLLF